MKKLFYFIAFSALILTSCDKDDDNILNVDPEHPYREMATINFNSPDLQFNSDGYWVNWDKNENLNLYDFRFSHFVDSAWGTVWGFIVSKNQETGYYDPMYTHPYTVVGGGGVNGVGSPYAVASWKSDETPDNRSLTITHNNFALFSPQSITVNNTTYAYFTMRDGNDFAKKFEAGDWFKLTIHGVTASGEERSVDFMLANCTSPNHPDREIISKWTKIDLTPLGEVRSLYFTLSSSDTGTWGMNTPGYFAIGSFSYIL